LGIMSKPIPSVARLARGRMAIAVFVMLLIVGSSLVVAAYVTSGGLHGTVGSVNVASSSFVLSLPQNRAGVTSQTVNMSPQTAFPGAVHGISNLKAGMRDRVQGVELTGTVSAIDATHGSFTLKLADGTTKTIRTNGQTTFDGGFHSCADLTTGVQAEV